MDFRAIETRYKGYRFRSRLEARWAVFFDALNIEWEYEKEGYDFEGERYLPDFWLPKHELFIEIKGQRPTEKEHRLCSLIRDYVAPIAIFRGLPDEHCGRLFCYDVSDGSAGNSEWQCSWCVPSRSMALLRVQPCGSHELYQDRGDTLTKIPGVEMLEDYPGIPLIDAAAGKAKSARFEFGERGAH